MEKSDADRIVNTINEKRLFKTEDISQYVKSTGLVHSKEDMVQILTSMVEKDPFYNFFLQEQLVECAMASDKYMRLIIKIAEKDTTVMALSQLIRLFGTNRDVCKFLYDKIKNIQGEPIALARGYLLGGIGQIEPKNLFDIINSHGNSSTEDKIAHALALRITVEKQKIPRSLVNLVISFSESDHRRLRQIAIDTMLWYLSSIKKVEVKLKQLTRNDEAAMMICNTLGPIAKQNKEFMMNLLMLCSKTSNSNVKRAMTTPLGILAPEFPLECLKIAKRWAGTPIFQSLYHDWYIGEIGKADTSKVREFLLHWIRKETRLIIKRFSLPYIVCEIYKNKEQELIDLIKSIDYRQKSKSDIIVQILDKFLSSGYGETRRTDAFVDECNNLLVKIATEHGIDTDPDPSLQSPFMKALALADAIENKERRPDEKTVRKNLKLFPKLVSFLGQRNIEKIIKNPHPLISIITRVNTSEEILQRIIDKINSEKDILRKGFLLRALTTRFYPASFLHEIEASLSLFDSNEHGMPRIRSGLLNKNEFFDTVAELSMAARLKKKYRVTLQPPFGKNKLDMQVTINGKDHLVEVYAPDTDIRLKYVKKAHYMGNKIKEEILKKLEKQIKSVASQNLPMILVIDRSRAMDLDEIEITDALFGSYVWTLVFDNQTGQTIQEYPSRKNDSISEMSPYGKIISAIIVLKRDMDDNDLKVKLYGKIFLNPQATIRLGDATVKTLEEAIFGNAVA